MSSVFGESMALVVVTWEPILHAVSPVLGSFWGLQHIGQTTQATTVCRQEVTGYIDTDENHVITCLECMVKTR